VDRITIKNLEVDAQIGVTETERARPQRLLISVELERDLAEAGRTDAETATTRFGGWPQNVLGNWWKPWRMKSRKPSCPRIWRSRSVSK